jgi:endoglucanase
VTWYPHLTGGSPSYTIDPNFLGRVKQVVDWAIADQLSGTYP